MKRITIITISLVALVVLIFIVLLIYRTFNSPSSPTPGTGNSTEFPMSSSTQTTAPTGTAPTMTVATSNGGAMTVHNFIQNGTTIKDAENEGVYYLAGSPNYCLPDGTCPTAAPADGFVVTYNTSGQSFTIILTNEPLGDSRKKAQAFLISTLGISSAQLCQLSSYLGTVNAVNETYSGTKLGFSGCPGATELP